MMSFHDSLILARQAAGIPTFGFHDSRHFLISMSAFTLLKNKGLANIKRSDFKAEVGPLITLNFNVALRNDLAQDGMPGVRGWKNTRLLHTGPS